MADSPLPAWLQQYGMWGAFLLMMMENMGVPFPTEAVFLYATLQVRAGRLSLVSAFTIITLGHLAGSALSYLSHRFPGA